MRASSQNSQLKGRLKLHKRNQIVVQCPIRSAALKPQGGSSGGGSEAHAPFAPQSQTQL
jgi:hypothetical protein